MAYSTVAYAADGVGATYAVPFPYLDKTHISVTVNGLDAAFTWLGDQTVVVTAVPTAGQTVFISRSSNRQARLVTFQDATVLTKDSLEEDAKQLFYVAQEAFDAVAAGNGTGDMLRANNLSDVLSVAAARANLAVAALAGATFTGPVFVPAPTLAAHAATKAYVDSAVAVSAAGVTSFNGRSGVVALTTADVMAAIGYTPMNPAGAAMSGLLLLSGPPVAALGAATKAYVDAAIAGLPVTGEANTASNLGAGSGVYASKTGVNLAFKSLIAGAGVTLTPTGTDITIAATAVGGGEVNDGLNLAVSGLGVYASKSGVHLQFKGIAAGLGMTQVTNTTDNTYGVNQAYPFTWSAAHKFLGIYAEPVLATEFNFSGMDQYAQKISRTSPAGATGDQAASIIHVKTRTTNTSFEWAQTIFLDNYANAGQNVGQYTKALKRGIGQTWGQTIEMQDISGSPNTTMMGLEIDMCGAGVDTGGFRRGLAIYYGDAYPNTFNAANGVTGAGNAIEIAPFNGSRNKLLRHMAIGGTATVAALDASTLVNTQVGLWLAGGSLIKFTSGNGGNAAGIPTWYFGAFTPTFTGALAVMVDSVTVYIPVCSNHP